MTAVVVTVKDGKANTRDLELPAERPVESLTPWIAKAIEHSDLPAEGEVVKYILKIENATEPIRPESSLRAAGVVHGDVLQLLIKTLPKELSESDAGRRFAGPGLVSADGTVFPFRVKNALVGRVDRASGLTESVLGVDLTTLDTEDSPSVSRRHAQVLLRKGSYLLHDLKSTNGTRVNGKELGPDSRVALQHGDRVQFGEVGLIFVWDGQEVDERSR
ncbi:MAG: FHA domain-containing protein [Anaerolineales bacterium]